jgi:hypothetical protein
MEPKLQTMTGLAMATSEHDGHSFCSGFDTIRSKVTKGQHRDVDSDECHENRSIYLLSAPEHPVAGALKHHPSDSLVMPAPIRKRCKRTFKNERVKSKVETHFTNLPTSHPKLSKERLT